jgi:hypothetical protein
MLEVVGKAFSQPENWVDDISLRKQFLIGVDFLNLHFGRQIFGQAFCTIFYIITQNNKHKMFDKYGYNQACQMFLGRTYQNGKYIPNGPNIYKIAVK